MPREELEAEEIGDFKKELPALGFDPADFEVRTERKDEVPGGPHALGEYNVGYRVFVRRKSTGMVVELKGGHGRNWVVPALDAAKVGRFGPR